MLTISRRTGPYECWHRRLIDTPTIGIQLLQIGLVIGESHRIALWYKCDRRSLLRSSLKFIEWQSWQHLAWISQIRSHPGSTAQRTVHEREQALITTIFLHLPS